MVDYCERLVSISFSKSAAFDVDQSSLELIGQNADNWAGRILLASVLTEPSHVQTAALSRRAELLDDSKVI